MVRPGLPGRASPQRAEQQLSDTAASGDVMSGGEGGASTISVITPSYNQGAYIRRTIQSVLDQGDDDWEHIVVDGGSTDETVAILESYPHLRWVSEPDRGQSDALNKAMSMSGGELIFWINSDDLVADGAFAAAREFFSHHPDAAILCGNAITIDDDDRVLLRLGPRVRRERLRRPWNGDTSMHQPSLVFRREVYDAVGPFDVSLHYAMDYDFFLRAASRFPVHHEPVDLGLFRISPGTKTGQGAARAFCEVRQSLVRHMRSTGDGVVWWTSLRGWIAQAYVLVNDAVTCYEQGDAGQARLLLARAFLRFPPSLLSKRHLYFRARDTLGHSNYRRLRSLISSPANNKRP